jgi:hypothetical protein
MYKYRNFRDDQEVEDINILINETTHLYQKMLDIDKELAVNTPKKSVLSNIDRYCTNIKAMLDKVQRQIKYVTEKKVDLVIDSAKVDYNKVAKKIYSTVVREVFNNDEEYVELSELEVRFDSDNNIMTITAEVNYDELWNICEAANKVIQRYDEDAYFDLEDSGFATCRIHNKGDFR